ncbi:hypothetical protein BJV74DRAFT_847271 [Russula compacta]|nr:hypothetical protein BJV74DRAFT_847271 [Russula compacta]
MFEKSAPLSRRTPASANPCPCHRWSRWKPKEMCTEVLSVQFLDTPSMTSKGRWRNMS